MFYEHFRESNFGSPYMLSFMYLGKNAKGQVNYNFQDYKKVEIAEFSKELQSINLVFQVLNQLPKCREVRFHLDDENILLSSEESNDQDNNFPCVSSTVTVLKIFRRSNNNDQSLVRRTRFTSIMWYAINCLPKLEHLYVEGMDGGGTSYDLVYAFCDSRSRFMPRHNITMQNGRTFCEPEGVPISSKPRNALHQVGRNAPFNCILPSSGNGDAGRNQPTLAPAKQEISVQTHESEPEVIVVENPLRSEPVPPLVVISDDEVS